MVPQRTLLMMLVVICLTILCFIWMVRDSLCGLRIQQGNTVLVATLACEVKR
ncbi:TPA: Hok/Gef family protein [Salmonella enterica]|uniref:Hok/Gef family protein n=2 Tax=Salmonella enterica TaxID=28901 RepID=A0A756LAT1_SALER|nr:Hok/Gef family protein [Salmonella enterica]EHX2188038.1 Hok/Gef family protein [Salmonella enterica subsp. enterica serovar Kedougou]EJE9730232.1 Hok/Gef family protein [Salmonella enterica]ELY9986669.1 Hok/Gef family protein [Salmonella enterica]HAG0017584.1 Hok/Gef family protein [Salmonella enterica]